MEARCPLHGVVLILQCSCQPVMVGMSATDRTWGNTGHRTQTQRHKHRGHRREHRDTGIQGAQDTGNRGHGHRDMDTEDTDTEHTGTWGRSQGTQDTGQRGYRTWGTERGHREHRVWGTQDRRSGIQITGKGQQGAPNSRSSPGAGGAWVSARPSDSCFVSLFAHHSFLGSGHLSPQQFVSTEA